MGRITIIAISLHATSWVNFVAQSEWVVTINWSLSVACDVTIATTLVAVLCSQRSHARSKTAALVDKLILWTIETGMLTSMSSGLLLACFLAMKANYVWFPFYAVAAGLLPNSLIASLNSRATLREMDQISLPVTAARAKRLSRA
ncbi:hypothetical protein C8R45DRAFT_1082874 [Mycena sanguinolenta]|nr:hypothetical protein C8R45DRAFT_1082874 [Mycena sanguinolenta]